METRPGPVLEDRDCAACGARNREDAEHCWQCYVRFGASAPVAVPPRPLLPPPPPPAPPVMPPAYSVSRPKGAQKVLAIVLGTVTTLAGAVGGWWAVDRLLEPHPFPESIAGVPLTDTADASELPYVQGSGLEGDVAIYGAPPVPEYALVVLDLPAGTSAETAWAQVTSMYGVEADQALKGPDGLARFLCGENPLDASAAFCLWIADEKIFELDGLSMPVEALRPTGLEVYAETSSTD